MARRRGWKRGDWLVEDEESGFVEYASRCSRDYYGVLKRKDQNDQQHPQDFVRAGLDPKVVEPLNPPRREYDVTNSYVGNEIGSTGVPVPYGAATHLFQQGIGRMEIEYDFIVT